MQKTTSHIIGLKVLRENTEHYIETQIIKSVTKLKILRFSELLFQKKGI